MTDDRKKIYIDDDESSGEDERAKKELLRVLGFVLGGENYCVDIRQMRSVERIEHITRVPNAPEFVLGATNLRGEAIAVLDIRYILGLQDEDRTGQTRIIITDAAGDAVGIVADRIIDTIDIDEAAIEPPLSTLNDRLKEFTKGQAEIEGNILILLDLKKILDCEEINRLKKGE